MRLSRSLTSQICRVLIGVLLFAQLAVAAYACPGQATRSTSMGGDMTVPAVVAQDPVVGSDKVVDGCAQLDSAAPNVCLEHCRAGHQTSDTAPVPVAFAPAPALLYLVSTGLEPIAGSSPSLPAADSLLASAPPPHAILHCVLRI